MEPGDARQSPPRFSSQQTSIERAGSEPTSTTRPTIGDREEVPAEEFDTTSTCVECGEQSFNRSNAGEWYCDACGAVHTRTEFEFSEPGWTPRDQRRTGPATSLSRVSIGTKVGAGGDTGTAFWARYNERLSHDNQTLRHGLRELRALTTTLEASESLTEQAAHLFRRAASEGLLIGHSIEAVAAACVHATARESYVPFPLKQIGEASPVAIDDIKTAVSMLLREFDLQVAPPLPSAFIARFASAANLPMDVRYKAYELCDDFEDDGAHVGQSPTGVGAALLYGAAKEADVDITQDELASIAYVSVVTLSRQWKTVKEFLDDECGKQ